MGASLSERDASLGADTKIGLVELSGDLTGDRRRRLSFAQYLQRLNADLAIFVLQEGEGSGGVRNLPMAQSHAVTPNRMDAGEPGSFRFLR